jgi:hypothetical protein
MSAQPAPSRRKPETPARPSDSAPPLQALPLLRGQFRIERARMRLKLTAPAAVRAALGELLEERGGVLESEAPGGGGGGGGACSLTVQVDPGAFRDLHAFMQREAQHQGRIEVLSFAVTTEGGGDAGGEYAAALEAAAAVAAAAAPRPAAGADDGAAGATAPRAVGAATAAARRSRGALGVGGGGGSGGGEAPGPSGRVVYEKGPVGALPEAFASRKERFQELDGLQPGWLVELLERGDSVDAVFYAPGGERVGPFAAARRAALQWKQAQQRGA